MAVLIPKKSVVLSVDLKLAKNLSGSPILKAFVKMPDGQTVIIASMRASCITSIVAMIVMPCCYACKQRFSLEMVDHFKHEFAEFVGKQGGQP